MVSLFMVEKAASRSTPKTKHKGRDGKNGLHDDSANDNSANDNMAARFWHTDDSDFFFLKKKAKNSFLPLTGFT